MERKRQVYFVERIFVEMETSHKMPQIIEKVITKNKERRTSFKLDKVLMIILFPVCCQFKILVKAQILHNLYIKNNFQLELTSQDMNQLKASKVLGILNNLVLLYNQELIISVLENGLLIWRVLSWEIQSNRIKLTYKINKRKIV